MSLQKNDFIEIEFTGKVKDGEIFDSNISEDIKKMNLNLTPKPFIFCLGEGMFVKGVDDFLIGKEIGKYEIELTPENAFGVRSSELVQIVPIKVFTQQKLNPVPGATFNFDGRIAKILTASGGRVIVDFNNPLAGKNIEYKIKILRKVENLEEKIKSFITFFFNKDFKFSIDGNKLIIESEKQFADIFKMFKEKFKEIFNLDLEIKEIEKSKKEKAEEKQISD